MVVAVDEQVEVDDGMRWDRTGVRAEGRDSLRANSLSIRK